jgi:hypothetical protein
MFEFINAQTVERGQHRMTASEGISIQPVFSCALYMLVATLAMGAPFSIAKPAYAYVIAPKPALPPGPDSPVIRRFELNKKHFSAHDEIQVQVDTTANVVKVTNHELDHGGNVAEGVLRNIFWEGTRRRCALFFERNARQHALHRNYREGCRSHDNRAGNLLTTRFEISSGRRSYPTGDLGAVCR